MIQFLKDLKNEKEFTMYALMQKSAPNTLLTLCLHKDEAKEYAHTLLREKYLYHFQPWCIRNGYDMDSYYAWNIYFNESVPDYEKDDYVIKKISYKYENVAAMLRMFGGCQPIGCSFDSEAEVDYANTKNATIEAHKKLQDFWDLNHEKIPDGVYNGK